MYLCKCIKQGLASNPIGYYRLDEWTWSTSKWTSAFLYHPVILKSVLFLQMQLCISCELQRKRSAASYYSQRPLNSFVHSSNHSSVSPRRDVYPPHSQPCRRASVADPARGPSHILVQCPWKFTWVSLSTRSKSQKSPRTITLLHREMFVGLPPTGLWAGVVSACPPRLLGSPLLHLMLKGVCFLVISLIWYLLQLVLGPKRTQTSQYKHTLFEACGLMTPKDAGF